MPGQFTLSVLRQFPARDTSKASLTIQSNRSIGLEFLVSVDFLYLQDRLRSQL